MGLINKTTFNFIVEQNGKSGRSLLTFKKQRVVNVQGINYNFQNLSTDVVEVSKKNTEIN